MTKFSRNDSFADFFIDTEKRLSILERKQGSSGGIVPDVVATATANADATTKGNVTVDISGLTYTTGIVSKWLIVMTVDMSHLNAGNYSYAYMAASAGTISPGGPVMSTVSTGDRQTLTRVYKADSPSGTVFQGKFDSYYGNIASGGHTRAAFIAYSEW